MYSFSKVVNLEAFLQFRTNSEFFAKIDF